MNKILRANFFPLFRKTYAGPSVQTFQINAYYSLSKMNTSPKLLNNIQMLQKRQFSSSNSEDGIFKKIKDKLYGSMSDRSKINIGACLCYEKCADEIDWDFFFKYYQLPDTFYSWFLAIQLHVWMISLVTVSEKNGRVFRNRIIEEMWTDVEQRLEHLTEMRSSTKKKNLRQLLEQFNASLISYDEGILDDDKALAAAAWRVFFGFKADVDPRLLESIVLYIRKQISYLDSLNSDEVMFRGRISFLSLKEVVREIDI